MKNWLLIFVVMVGVALVRADAPAGPTLPAVTVEKPVVISWKDFKGYLFAKKDVVVAVDCWATWCVPCVEALPDLEKFIQSQKGKPVQVILLSLDDPEDTAAVTARLKAAGVSVGSYIIDPADRDAMVKEMSANWKAAEVPAGFVFDRTGKNVDESIGKAHTFAEWLTAIKAAKSE